MVCGEDSGGSRVALVDLWPSVATAWSALPCYSLVSPVLLQPAQPCPATAWAALPCYSLGSPVLLQPDQPCPATAWAALSFPTITASSLGVCPAQVKKLPRSMTVGALRMLCDKLFKV